MFFRWDYGYCAYSVCFYVLCNASDGGWAIMTLTPSLREQDGCQTPARANSVLVPEEVTDKSADVRNQGSDRAEVPSWQRTSCQSQKTTLLMIL